MWLVAIFEKQLKNFVPQMHKDEVVSRRTEGARLACLLRREINLLTDQVFKEYCHVFLQCDSFDLIMAPFISRSIGASWFQRDFLAQNPK